MQDACASCGHPLEGRERFCPMCGRPTLALIEKLRAQADATGQPFEALVAAAYAEQLITRTLEPLTARVDRLDARLAELEARLSRLEGGARPAHSAEQAPPTPEVTGPAAAPAPSPEPVPPPPERTPSPPSPPAEQPAHPTREIPPQPASPRRGAWTLGDLEDLIGRRALAWLGGLALLLGAVFFLSLAFSRGWIGPAARVGIGLSAGALLVLVGARFFDRRERLFGHVLVAAGIGIVSVSLLAATRLYQLVRVELGLGGTLLTAVAAAVIAIRSGSPVVAGYGIVAALLAPPLLGASPSGVTIGYLSALLVGTKLIALYRSWRWLPPLAFVLSVPQVAEWIASDPPRSAGLAAVTGFWLLHLVAAGGEEFRVRRDTLGISSTTLLVANVTFAVWAGFRVLDGDAERWRGAFLTGLALGHGVVAAYFLRDRGERHPFGLLAAGTGIATLSLAVPVQLGGPWVPMAWAAEAAALAWLYAVRRHGYSAVLAVALGALTLAHLVTVEYPLWDIVTGRPTRLPFVNASGGTLAFCLAALGVAAWCIRSWRVRALLVTLGCTLVTYALPFELSDRPLLAGWATVFVVSVGIARRVVLRRAESAHPPAPGSLVYLVHRVPYLAAILSAELAVFHALAFDLPLARIGLDRPERPFTDEHTLSAVILIAASLAAGALEGGALARSASVVVSAAIAAYLMPFETQLTASVVAWAGIALALGVAARWDVAGRVAYQVTAGLILAFGLAVTLEEVAPPERLIVTATRVMDHPPFWSGATAALGALAAVLAAGYWEYRRSTRHARWLAFLAAVLVVYLLSVGVVDAFQRRVGGPTPLEELQKQAQVALSILWGTLGVATFVFGLARRSAAVRSFALALLSVTTVKVYLYDLAALDAAYRVLSFVGLGILLLVSSYLYQRFVARPSDDAQATQRS